MSNLIVLTGARGTGKSTLAATYLAPADVGRMFVHDSENSMNRIVAQLADSGLAFGRYVSLQDRFTDLPGDKDLLARINAGKLPWVDAKQKRSLAAYYRYILKDLDEHLGKDRYDVYVHDTLEKLEAGMVAWVELNKKVAGVTTMAHGRLWTEGVYPLYEQFLAGMRVRGVKTVILTSHLKTPWEDNHPVTGKVAPGGKKLLYRLSSLMIWLVNEASNSDGAPAGLVLKERMGQLRPTEDGTWRIRRMLPRRIPHCTWQDINRYLQDGCDLANPAPGETLSKGERQMISELLTDEQMRLMVLAAEKELEELKQETAPVLGVSDGAFDPGESAQDAVRRLLAEGQNAQEIAKTISKPLPLVKRWVQEIEKEEQNDD